MHDHDGYYIKLVDALLREGRVSWIGVDDDDCKYHAIIKKTVDVIICNDYDDARIQLRTSFNLRYDLSAIFVLLLSSTFLPSAHHFPFYNILSVSIVPTSFLLLQFCCKNVPFPLTLKQNRICIENRVFFNFYLLIPTKW